MRWNVIATLQSPTARWPASSSARVTIPTGFVKSTIHAPGAARSPTRSASSSITGTVRIAFAKPRAPADDLEPLGVDVVQRDLADVELRQVRHELRRVRRACADHGELHPLTPVSVTPSTKAFWARKKSTICSTQWCGFSPV